MEPYKIAKDGGEFYVFPKSDMRVEFLVEHDEVDPKDVGLIALGAFRNKNFVDYVAVAEIDDVAETETWRYVHGQLEWFDWMAGVVYHDRERSEQLRRTERELGRFAVTQGWNPDYVLDLEPSEYEIESFIDYTTSKDVVNGRLILPEEDSE